MSRVQKLGTVGGENGKRISTNEIGAKAVQQAIRRLKNDRKDRFFFFFFHTDHRSRKTEAFYLFFFFF